MRYITSYEQQFLIIKEIKKYKTGATYRGQSEDIDKIKISGDGVFTDSNRNIFEGFFEYGNYNEDTDKLNAKFNGIIKYFNPNRTYIGNSIMINENIPEIKELIYTDKFNNKSTVKGDFKIENGYLNGNGKQFSQSRLYRGDFKEGKLIKGFDIRYTGPYDETDENQPFDFKQEGTFADNELNGKNCTEINNYDKIKLEGTFQKDKIVDGTKTGLTYKNVYKGTFQKGKMSGNGELSDKDGKIIHSGEFENDMIKKDGKLYNFDINSPNFKNVFTINEEFLENNKNNVFYKLKSIPDTVFNPMIPKNNYLGKFIKRVDPPSGTSGQGQYYLQFETRNIQDNEFKKLSDFIEETEEIKSSSGGKKKSKRISRKRRSLNAR
jgi:hypothetical protein